MIFKTIINRIFKITLTTKLNLWLMIGTFATDAGITSSMLAAATTTSM